MSEPGLDHRAGDGMDKLISQVTEFCEIARPEQGEEESPDTLRAARWLR